MFLHNIKEKIKNTAANSAYNGIKRYFNENGVSFGKNGIETDIHLAWENNLAEECSFWEKRLLELAEEPGRISWKRDENAKINENILQLLPDKETGCNILDVGSGPRPWLGNKTDGKNIELVCCDPLADVYKELLMKYKLPLIKEILKAETEKLLEIFKYNQFDIVTARNCLDHSYSPEQCILQMAAVSKRYVYLLHIVNEGKKENYTGLHKWDFDCAGDDFIISSWNGIVFNITKKYSHCFSFKTRKFDTVFNGLGQHWLEVIIEKK